MISSRVNIPVRIYQDDVADTDKYKQENGGEKSIFGTNAKPHKHSFDRDGLCITYKECIGNTNGAMSS